MGYVYSCVEVLVEDMVRARSRLDHCQVHGHGYINTPWFNHMWRAAKPPSTYGLTSISWPGLNLTDKALRPFSPNDPKSVMNGLSSTSESCSP